MEKHTLLEDATSAGRDPQRPPGTVALFGSGVGDDVWP